MKYYTEQLSDKGTVAVDDTILVKGVQAAAGSRIMEGFKPLFSAEAVTRLENKVMKFPARLMLVSLVWIWWESFPTTQIKKMLLKAQQRRQ